MQGETFTGGHGVRPSDVFVESNRDIREVANSHTHHIQATGNGEVHLPKSIDARPRKLAVVSLPNAHAFEPNGESSSPISLNADDASAISIGFESAAFGVDEAGGAGGRAPSMASAKAAVAACTAVNSLWR